MFVNPLPGIRLDHFGAVFICFVMTCFLWVCPARALTIQMGDVSIEIPAPEGCLPVEQTAPQLMAMAQKMQPPGLRLNGLYVTQEDLRGLLLGRTLSLDYSAEVKSIPELDHTDVTTDDIRRMSKLHREHANAIWRSINENAEALTANARNHLNEVLDAPVDMTFGMAGPVDIIEESDTHFTGFTMSRLQVQDNGDMVDRFSHILSTTLLVRKRLVMLASVRTGDVDMEAAKGMLARHQAWLEAVRAANAEPTAGQPREEKPETTPQAESTESPEEAE